MVWAKWAVSPFRQHQFPTQTFLRERERYLLRIKDAKSSGSNIAAISLKSSVYLDLLLSLVEFGEFEGISDIDSLIEEALKTWLNAKEAIQFDTLAIKELENAVRASVRMSVNEKDPELRIKALFMDYKTFLRIRRCGHHIPKNPKQAVLHICSLLKPPALKEKIENDLALSQHDLKKKWLEFYRYVVEQAVRCDEFASIKSTVREEEDYKRKEKFEKRSYGSRSKMPSASGSSGSSKRNRRDGDQGKRPDSNVPTERPTASEHGNDSEKELPLCLNTMKCKERHFVKYCPVSTEDEKQNLLKEFYKNKSAKGRLSVLAQTPEAIQSLQGSGRYFATLADVVNVVVDGDYGADHSALSKHHIRICADAGVFVQTLTLAKPISMTLALGAEEGQDSQNYLADSKVRISVTLNTPEGPFRLRNLEFLVFNEFIPEVLIASPVLQKIGFNLVEHLKRVHHQFHDADFSHIGFSSVLPHASSVEPPKNPGRLAWMLLSQSASERGRGDPESVTDSSNDHAASAAFYGDVQDDSPQPKDADILSGQDEKDLTNVHLKERISEAIANGLPLQSQDELKRLVNDYRDIFRTKLGADPPASVPAMIVRLKEDAVPVQVKVRRYSPLQAQFLRTKVDELLKLGLVRRNNSSQWACAPLIVPKPGPEQFRFTVELRPVNSQPIPHSRPMPDTESTTAELSGGTCFGKYDFCHGYWQMPLDDDSRECQSFVTPDGVFTPNRVMNEQTNASS